MASSLCFSFISTSHWHVISLGRSRVPPRGYGWGTRERYPFLRRARRFLRRPQRAWQPRFSSSWFCRCHVAWDRRWASVALVVSDWRRSPNAPPPAPLRLDAVRIVIRRAQRPNLARLGSRGRLVIEPAPVSGFRGMSILGVISMDRNRITAWGDGETVTIYMFFVDRVFVFPWTGCHPSLQPIPAPTRIVWIHECLVCRACGASPWLLIYIRSSKIHVNSKREKEKQRENYITWCEYA